MNGDSIRGSIRVLGGVADVDGSALVGQLSCPFPISMIIMPQWKP